MEDCIEVNLVGLILDPVSKSPVMVLKSLIEKKVIPIWIGINEANAIAQELENVCSPRPMTHDLMKNILCNLDAVLSRVIITDIIENTYYAELRIVKGGQEKTIDCRPSDAVALALKNKSRIFVSKQVLETSVLADVFNNFLNDEDKIGNWFNSLNQKDFGEIEQ
jgi:bifunctional DNase/RNase